MPYTRNLIAHRGTDNRILFEFVNQDQKPTPLNGIEFIFRMISTDGTTLLMEKLLEVVNQKRGQARVVLTEEDLDKIPTGTAQFSIERHYYPYAITPIEPPIEPPIDPETGLPIEPTVPIYPPECLINGPKGPQDPVNPDTFQKVDFEPVFVDDNAGGRGNIDIVDSIMPSFVASQNLLMPEITGTLPDYDSSIINTNDQALHTFQIKVLDFSGTISFQGGTDTDNQWYEILTEDFVNRGQTIGVNIEGYHPYLKISIANNTNGEIENIIYR